MINVLRYNFIVSVINHFNSLDELMTIEKPTHLKGLTSIITIITLLFITYSRSKYT